jgi:cytochrome c553
MRRFLPALCGTALVLAMAPGLAAGSTAGASTGNIENGQLLAFTCAGCHGIEEFRNAYPNFRVPKIAGQNETYLVNALKAYRSGDRSHPTMVAQASSFSEQDIADLAAYFASRKPQQQDRRP